jgi:membrane dipeptidase
LKRLVLDGHADTPQRFLDEYWNFNDPLGRGMLNLDAARAGGLSGEFFAIWVDPTQFQGRFAHRAFELIDAVHQQVARAPAALALCRSAAEIEAAHNQDRFAVMLGLEGGHAIEDSLALLRSYYRLGVRSMTLTWSHSVGWADSSGDTEDPAVTHSHGLTPFGRDVIREMNRLGMMVDVSHVSDETFWAVLETSAAPVIASHSSARALTQAPRNLTDDQLRALCRSGGIAMVNFFPAFIDEAWRLGWNALKPERDDAQTRAAEPFHQRGEPVPFAVSDQIDRIFAAKLPPAPFEFLVDHIEHMLAVAGPAHVGLGSDFDGIPLAPQGMETAAHLPKIAEALEQRGHSENVIAGVLGGNLLRVLRAVEDHAEKRNGASS